MPLLLLLLAMPLAAKQTAGSRIVTAVHSALGRLPAGVAGYLNNPAAGPRELQAALAGAGASDLRPLDQSAPSFVEGVTGENIDPVAARKVAELALLAPVPPEQAAELAIAARLAYSQLVSKQKQQEIQDSLLATRQALGLPVEIDAGNPLIVGETLAAARMRLAPAPKGQAVREKRAEPPAVAETPDAYLAGRISRAKRVRIINPQGQKVMAAIAAAQKQGSPHVQVRYAEDHQGMSAAIEGKEGRSYVRRHEEFLSKDSSKEVFELEWVQHSPAQAATPQAYMENLSPARRRIAKLAVGVAGLGMGLTILGMMRFWRWDPKAKIPVPAPLRLTWEEILAEGRGPGAGRAHAELVQALREGGLSTMSEQRALWTLGRLASPEWQAFLRGEHLGHVIDVLGRGNVAVGSAAAALLTSVGPQLVADALQGDPQARDQRLGLLRGYAPAFAGQVERAEADSRAFAEQNKSPVPKHRQDDGSAQRRRTLHEDISAAKGDTARVLALLGSPEGLLYNTDDHVMLVWNALMEPAHQDAAARVLAAGNPNFAAINLDRFKLKDAKAMLKRLEELDEPAAEAIKDAARRFAPRLLS